MWSTPFPLFFEALCWVPVARPARQVPACIFFFQSVFFFSLVRAGFEWGEIVFSQVETLSSLFNISSWWTFPLFLSVLDIYNPDQTVVKNLSRTDSGSVTSLLSWPPECGDDDSSVRCHSPIHAV